MQRSFFFQNIHGKSLSFVSDTIDTTTNEYATQADINRELIMSANTMEDNYVLSNKSRQRDRDVLAAANRAIVSTLYCSQNVNVRPLYNQICKISTLSPRQK